MLERKTLVSAIAAPLFAVVFVSILYVLDTVGGIFLLPGVMLEGFVNSLSIVLLPDDQFRILPPNSNVIANLVLYCIPSFALVRSVISAIADEFESDGEVAL